MRSKRRPGMFLSGGSQSFEFVTFLSTVAGIIGPPILMILFRLLAVLIGIVIVLCVGEQSAALLLFGLCIYLYLGTLLGTVRHLKRIPFLFYVSGALIIVAIADYWPSTVLWKRIDGQMHYQLYWVFENKWLKWASVNTGMVPITPLVLWLRFIITGIVPIIALNPLRFADWAAGIETLWTNARQVTFRPADPGTIPGTDEFGVLSPASPESSEEDSIQVITVPEPTVRGTF